MAGKEELIKKISYKLTTNGIGKECGLMYGQTRSILQGLFFAPRVTTDAIKVSLLFAKVFENLGYATSPHSTEKRIGIIQRITLFDKNKLLAFLKVIQKSSPVDSFATPEPSYMPGYENDIIMAAGGFVAGSSIELSCDAPFISPYDVYIQGSLTYEHGKIALENILNEFIKKEYIK